MEVLGLREGSSEEWKASEERQGSGRKQRGIRWGGSPTVHLKEMKGEESRRRSEVGREGDDGAGPPAGKIARILDAVVV